MNQCEHPNTQACRYIQTNGVTIVVLQCLDCGNNLRALPKASYKIGDLPDWNINLQTHWATRMRSEWEAKRNEEVEKFRQEQESKTGEWWDKYNDYLRSDHWRKLRNVVLNRDVVCQCCFKLRSAEAHHLSYESFKKWGFSFSVECVGLCSGCHAQIHDKEKP